MLENFIYTYPTTMIFGKDTDMEVGAQVKKYSDKCLIHHDGGAYLEALIKRVKKSLEDAGVEVFELGGVRPNPKLSLMREGMKICRDNEINFVLAIGGGSVMDSTKFIALGTHYDGDPWDCPSFAPVPSEVLSHGCICTLPGTGSEVSNCSMVVNDEGEFEVKHSFFADELRFNFCIINPELTYSLPAKQTASGAVDIISHFMESYFTSTIDAEMLMGIAETGINNVKKNVKIVLENPKDYTARANMLQAAYYAMDGAMYAGTTSDWAVHGFENPMTVTYHSTHGLMLGIMTPAWMKYVYKRNIPLFTRFCVNCFGAQMDYMNPELTIKEGIANFESFVQSLGLPTRLSEIDIDDSKFDFCAQTAVDNSFGGKVGMVSQLSKEEIIKIYKLAL
ncbi:MAG: iron-containing alcohol dehydrogenase [Lachnospiraceae bacterium]|nr:iron-containing alcohol dehydrogenase [Lachnospiraceae bacterium]